MTDVPDRIDLRRHRDLGGRSHRIWVRRALAVLLLALLGFGLADAFGQQPRHTYVDSPTAELELYAPVHLRGGLLYEARFTITAHRDVKNAILQLSPGWNEGQQMNTIEPSPLGQASRNGDLLFTLGHIPAGQKYRLYMQFQVNPTNVGRRNADVTLYDGGTELVHIHHRLTFYP